MALKMDKMQKESLVWLTIKNAVQVLAAVAVMAALWAAAYFAVGNELLVPSLSNCFNTLADLLCGADFWTALGNSLLRVFFAFFISLVFGLIFAVIAYLLPAFERFFSVIVTFLRTTPTLALLLLILVWSSAGVAPVIVAFLSLFPMLYTAILAALSGVDGELLEMGKVYKVPLKKRIFQLYLPSALPYVTREGSAALSFALKLVVSAEVLADTYKSLGGMMGDAKRYLDVPLLFALLLVTFVMGAVVELCGFAVAKRIERRVK